MADKLLSEKMIDKWMRNRPVYIREFSINKIKNGKTYRYPDWYYDSKDEAIKKRICQSCGEPLPKGKRAYCGKTSCHGDATIYSLGISSVRREVHKRFGFACTHCGVMFVIITKGGVHVPLFSGISHHVIPLEYGGEDDFDNLTLVCDECHKIEHRRLRKKYQFNQKGE